MCSWHSGRPHPKANLDRWRAKQHSTSGHVSTLCCSFLNPTLNGSSLTLLADIQVLCTWMSLKNVMAILLFFFLVLSFQRGLSTANLNLQGKYKGAIIKFSWKTNTHSRDLWCVHLQHAVSFKLFLSFVVVNNCLTLCCLKTSMGKFTLGCFMRFYWWDSYPILKRPSVNAVHAFEMDIRIWFEPMYMYNIQYQSKVLGQ